MIKFENTEIVGFDHAIRGIHSVIGLKIYRIQI